jgi:hypothetical protein
MKAQPNEPAGFETLSEALEDLKVRGFVYDFNMVSNGLQSNVDGEVIHLSPSEFEIVEVHRFEGATNPSDNSILYAIESRGGLKGNLVSAYGVYADALSAEMIEKLDTRQV